MNTRVLLILLVAAFLPLFRSLAATGFGESNPCLVDTENPDIDALVRTPAVRTMIAAALANEWEGLRERSKLGVFFSHGPNPSGAWRFQLIERVDPFPPASPLRWSVDDLGNNPPGELFMMSGGGQMQAGFYQPIPEDLSWSIANTSLSGADNDWNDQLILDNGGNNELTAFRNQLNPGAGGIASLYKRFSFPRSSSALNEQPLDGEPWKDDIRRIDFNKQKLVVVIHGWNPDGHTDPYAEKEFSGLLEELHNQIQSNAGVASEWDLYAYNWAGDAATGVTFLGSAGKGHADFGGGSGQQNGTQAAEIGYQHGLVLGKVLRDEYGLSLEKVHFIAHSAGTWVARSASLYLEATKGTSDMAQQVTLLDPYNPHRGFEQWPGTDREDSPLDSESIDEWPILLTDGYRFENAYSLDGAVYGTNERYWGGGSQGTRNGIPTANKQTGWNYLGNTYDWDGHGGPINYYAWTVKPFGQRDSLTAKQRTWLEKGEDVSWEFSMFMEEVKTAESLTLIGQRKKGLYGTGYSASNGTSTTFPSGQRPSPAPTTSGRIAVSVDEHGWVRVMIVPAGGGAAIVAGPSRLGGDGSFQIELEDGRILSGQFDLSISVPTLALDLDGVALAQEFIRVEGSSSYAGTGGVLDEGIGELTLVMVLADGTTLVSVEGTDAFGDPWSASAVGTVDASGNLNAASSDGFSVSGKVGAGGGLEEGSTVVDPPDDVVTNQPPTAYAKKVSSREDQKVAIKLTGKDPDGDPLKFRVAVGPKHGKLTGTAPNLVYVPNANSYGTDSFRFVANDGTIDSSPATIQIVVAAANDPPVARKMKVSVAGNTKKVFRLKGSDIDTPKAKLRYQIVKKPKTGKLKCTKGGKVTYIPKTNYKGTVKFKYRVSDGKLYSKSQNVKIQVKPPA